MDVEATSGPRAGRARRRARFEWALVALGVVVLATCLDVRISSDGDQRFRDLRQLMRQHSLAASPYSLVSPFLAVPLYVLGQQVASPRFWVARFNLIVFLAGLGAMTWLVARLADARVARVFALLMLGASVFPYHAKDFFGDMFSAVLASIGLLAIAGGGGTPGAVALGLSAANQPATLLGVGLAVGRAVLASRRARYLVAVLVPLALILLENLLRRGHPLVTGYEQARGFETLMPYSGRPGFSYPLVLGIGAILVSFGKGLVFFMPGLFVPVRDGLRPVRALFVLYVGGLVLVYANWWAWYGGWVWGPRFFAAGSTLACLALADRVAAPRGDWPVRWFVVAAILWSAWVSVSGSVFELRGLDRCLENRHEFEFLCWYVPEFSPLVRPWIDGLSVTRREAVLAGYSALVALVLVGPLVIREAADLARALPAAARRLSTGSWRW